MGKKIADLTAEEMDRLAGDAWFAASNAALRDGAPVVGRQAATIVKTYPDGRQKVIESAAPMVDLAESVAAPVTSASAGATRRRR